MNRSFIILILMSAVMTFAKTQPDWTKEARINPGENRKNIYQISNEDLENYKMAGYIHAMKYPITVTGLLIPYRPIKEFFNLPIESPLKQLLLQLNSPLSDLKAETELYKWLGLSKVNGPDAKGIYKMPYPNGEPDQFYAGAGIINTPQGEGLTFSCFACHASSLFGTTVMGLTNKRPHANKLFEIGRLILPHMPEALYRESTHASEGEMQMYSRTKRNIASVDGVVPQVLGLDTSLAHVTLSLARRNRDGYATKNPFFENHPRDNELNHFVADSKPMPWWNLKYKTRWLSDGSIVSGNPIFTNFLWNEIGRGTDLRELEEWMKKNGDVVEKLTAAVFATEAPRFTDFFPASSINLERAKRGEKLFVQSCAGCHGTYVKAWSNAKSSNLSEIDILETTKVIYHERTPVRDVGTDPQRYQATKYFANTFNNLVISKWMQTVIEPQVGYVPPPLVGIWARYPYFHNASIPNLCALLSIETERPKIFIIGPAVNKNTDFDRDCVGYPVGNKIPDRWLLDQEAKIDTRKPGLRNIGHTKMFLDSDGNEKFTPSDKTDLIEFLKTL